jgi:hypothetical protein
MANQLKMAQVHAIQVLREQGWSRRRIARELGIHRETIARYLRLARAGPPSAAAGCQAKPAKVITGSDGATGAPPGQTMTREPWSRSRCEPFRQVILRAIADPGPADGEDTSQREHYTASRSLPASSKGGTGIPGTGRPGTEETAC